MSPATMEPGLAWPALFFLFASFWEMGLLITPLSCGTQAKLRGESYIKPPCDLFAHTSLVHPGQNDSDSCLATNRGSEGFSSAAAAGTSISLQPAAPRDTI